MPTTGKKQKELSLYIHVPFCLKKCPYCHFYSVYPQAKLLKDFTEALLLHLEMAKIEPIKLISIYFGGGTPSLMPASFFENILSKIAEKINIPQKTEITLEANPSEMELGKFKAFRKLGINRLSIGMQSFDDSLLKVLKRTHNAKAGEKAIYIARKAGFENISCDLMYDIPYQTEESFLKTVKKTVGLPISHISLYNLVFEENTPFYNQKELQTHVLKEKDSLNCLKKALAIFEKANFKQYEISAFAKKGQASKHNLGYWTGRPFWGFGPSAFSYMDGKRFQNSASLKEYINLIVHQKKEPVSFSEQLEYPQNIRELLAINLRVLKGVDLNDFQKKQGQIDAAAWQALEELSKQKLLKQSKNRLKLTKKGLFFYDEIASAII